MGFKTCEKASIFCPRPRQKGSGSIPDLMSQSTNFHQRLKSVQNALAVKLRDHISLTNKRAAVMLPYYVHGQVLEHVTSFDYVGVRLTNKLNWKEHCDKASNKANRSLGLVKRTLNPCTPEVKERAYQLGWASLECTRLLAQVSLFYKIKNNLIDLEFPSSIQPPPRSMMQHAMLQPYSSVLVHSYSPFVRTVRVWTVNSNSPS